MNSKALDEAVIYLDSWLRFNYERSEVPGYVVAVAHKNKLVFNRAYGFANLESQEKLAAGHLFRISSQSKTFTATAVMQMAEQGKLRIDDYIADYLPWVNDHNDKRFQKITIRQLLSHSAGLIRDGLDSDYWQLSRPFPDAKQLINEVLDAKLIFDTNIQMKYSNIGYALLGLLIEAVSGMTYNKFVASNIVRPLGLKNTGPDYTKDIQSKMVTGYTRRDLNKTRLPIANVTANALSPATGFYSTTEDLCKYFSAQIIGSNKLLNDESKKEMQRAQWRIKGAGDDEYGLGFEIEHADERLAIAHGGGFPGHSTFTICDPKAQIVVSVMVNCIDGPSSWIGSGILFSIIDFFDRYYSSRKSRKNLKAFQGRFMDLWSIVDIVAAGNKVVSVNPDSWRPFDNHDELEYEDESTLRLMKATSFYPEGELIRFNFDKDKRVSTITYAGGTMWPEADWLKKQLKIKIIADKSISVD